MTRRCVISDHCQICLADLEQSACAVAKQQKQTDIREGLAQLDNTGLDHLVAGFFMEGGVPFNKVRHEAPLSS